MVKVENEAPARWRKPSANGYSLHPRQAHISSTLLILFRMPSISVQRTMAVERIALIGLVYTCVA